MALFSPEKIISDLIPFVLKILPNEEDEVLLAVSEEVPHFKTYLNDKQITNALPIFQFLLGCEETVVRESAVEGMRKLITSLSDDQVQKDIVPLILNIANQEAFQWKVSSICLIRTTYPKAGKEKDKLRSLYFKLCDDETPIIKRTAAKEFGPLCLVIEKDHVSNDMITYYKKFMNETDSVRVTILPSLVQLAKLFQNSDLQKTNLQFVVAASEDKSWRVRNELAIIFPQFIEYFSSQINELVPTLSNLIKDSETEVKISALKSLNMLISKISSDKIQACVIPSLRGLNNESSKEVKANVGESFGPIAKIIGYSSFNTNLGVMMDTLMKDENADVRLGANYVLDVFKSSIESVFFNYLNDNVASVREVGINSLKLLNEKFGSAWIVSTLIPKLHLPLLRLRYLTLIGWALFILSAVAPTV